MPSFRYQARLPDGRIQSGMAEAPTLAEAEQALLDRQYEILAIEPAKRNLESGANSLISFLNRVSPKELVGALRMLSVMVSASVPIVDALRNLATQTKNPTFKAILTDAADEVDGGARLSDTLEKYPSVFSSFFTSMVRSGETTGQMAEVMLFLADQQEKDYDLMSKLRGALAYPAFIVTGMAVAGTVMMVYVVPKLTKVLEETGTDLPLSTRLLIWTSNAMVSYWWVFILGIAAFAAAFIAWIRTPYGRYQWDWFKLRVPVLGSLLRDMYLVRFCQGMGTLLQGEIPLVQALEISVAVVENAVWKKMLLETIQAVNDGQPLVSVMAREKAVPSMAVQMMAVGEATGKLTDVLKRLGDFYGRSVANMSANVLTLIEPIVMVVLGLGVGVMVSAIMLPLYRVSSGM